MRATGALLLIACLGAGPAQAGDLFRWTDRDNAPTNAPTPADVVRPAAPRAANDPHAAVASLHLETRDDVVEAWADNPLAGPIEVLLRPLRGSVEGADPPLPARTTVPTFQRRLVARLASAQGAELRLDVVHGDPNARPDDVEYGYPLRTAGLQIEQGWGGAYSHSDAQNRHAVDFAAEIGTPVIAARAGRVMEVEAGFERAGLNAGDDAARANFVRIVHDDGTMALYAHLDAGGVLVRMGQHVRKGETIGRSGNTGYTTGPHLHFAVQANRGMRLESIPFRMFGPQGILRFTEPRVERPSGR